jgi:hypothetical protein
LAACRRLWQRKKSRGEATEIDLTWARNGLSARQQWHGHEAITDIGDGDFAKLVQAGFCHLQWLRELPTVLAPALNVFVETGAGGPPMAFYYPDGLMLLEQLVIFDDARTQCVVYPGPIRGMIRSAMPRHGGRVRPSDSTTGSSTPNDLPTLVGVLRNKPHRILQFNGWVLSASRQEVEQVGLVRGRNQTSWQRGVPRDD